MVSQLPMMVSAADPVDGFQLALRLQDDGCRNLTVADGGDQLIKLRDQPNVRKLIGVPAVHDTLADLRIDRLHGHKAD